MATPPWHILLIEDNPDDRADLRQMLLQGSSRRYRFSEAELGAEGVRMVLDPRHGPVDCVLLDYALPDMDGRAVLAALCGGGDSPPCPVVVVTGRAIEEGPTLLGAGAQDYIGKRWTSAESLTRAVENAVERFALLAQRRCAEQALRASDERYRALFNAIDAGYVVIEMLFDAQGRAVDARLLQANAAFTRRTGLANAEGGLLSRLIPDLEPAWLEALGTVALSGAPVRMELRSEVLQSWFDVHAFRLGEPQARQVAVLFNDTTARKHSESALMAAKAEAETANRAKSDFLMSMSHELRSPLNAMLGFAQLIEAGAPAPTPAQQDSLAQILQAGWYLLGLINEILDLSAIESGKLVLLVQEMALDALLDDCQAMIEPQAQDSGIQIHFPRFEQPCLVLADSTRVKQVLLNLLTNAIKYNRTAGRVDVHCSVTADQQMRVSVADTGQGLSAAQMAQLFQPFNRLGQETGSAPGTGIGLVISKRLVDLMGGRIGVDSTVGVGSCFWFELGLAAARPGAAKRLPQHSDAVHPP